MKRMLQLLGLSALAMCLLTVFALADMGPKPLLTLRVEHAPQEPYYLDILAEGDFSGQDYNGISWNYDEAERASLDQDLLTALRAAVPEGYHACTAEGTNGAPMWGELEGTPPAVRESISTPSAISAYRTPIGSS